MTPAHFCAQQSDNPDTLYDENAAAAYLGGENRPFSARTLQRWRAEKKGPAYLRIGRLIRYRRSALDSFLAAGEQKPQAVA
jgi:hypothetical protein